MTVREYFKENQVCVIIPTYNNASALADVIKDVLEYTENVIVVNDGSTDHTGKILDTFPLLKIISYVKNTGKGWALRKAFRFAAELGYRYGITIDSDGQHFAKDLPVFMKKLQETPNAIIIGARNMDQESVPGGSSFGNRFSNFWFWVETGIRLPDTQSGYRLYPLEQLSKMRYFTRKYEFEIEVLVRAAWNGIDIVSVPVSVFYAAKEQRVSHFRPFKDFFRISILNTILVLICFLYIKPRNLLRSIFVQKDFTQKVKNQLLNPDHSIQSKSLSVALGVFMGIIPIWGFQLVIAIFLAILLKLNKPLVIIAANISLPPMIPIIIFLSYQMGTFWMGDNAVMFDFSNAISLEAIKINVIQYIYGSITLAILAACFFGLLTFILLKLFKRKTPEDSVIN